MNVRIFIASLCLITVSVIAYGSGPPLTGWECSPGTGNCDFDCMYGTREMNPDDGTVYCIVLWGGADKKIGYKICIPSEDPMSTCQIEALPEGTVPVPCPKLKYKYCGIYSGGNGCGAPLPGTEECKCEGKEDGIEDKDDSAAFGTCKPN